jgi:hypothetical protein
MASRTVTLSRLLVEETIERLIAALDQIDGDPDFEDDELEEPHDAEAELTWLSACVPSFFIIAEAARRRGDPRR